MGPGGIRELAGRAGVGLLRPLLVIATVIAALLAVPAAAAAATLTGPDKVKPGSKVTFKLTGYKPNSQIIVFLERTAQRGDPQRCAAVFSGPNTDSAGAATLRFRFRRRCAKPGKGGFVYKKWPPGSRVDVSVRTPPDKFRLIARKVVRLKGGGGLPTENFKVRGGKTVFTAVCPSSSTEPCKGKATIRATVKRKYLGGGNGRRKINVVKRHSYSAPIGGTDKVKLKLTKPARQYFKHRRTLVGTGTLKAHSGKKTKFKAVLKR